MSVFLDPVLTTLNLGPIAPTLLVTKLAEDAVKVQDELKTEAQSVSQ